MFSCLSTSDEENYFNFLCSIVGIDSPYSRDVIQRPYRILARRMFEREFYFSIERDINRAEDGIHLREMWLNNHVDGLKVLNDMEFMREPCSVLEMLVALSQRIENNIFYDIDEGNRAWVWFSMILKNLDLQDCTDNVIDAHLMAKVDRNLSTALDRTYDFYGRGGFFPLSFTNTDQRDEEIWYQMQHFIMEHFDVIS